MGMERYKDCASALTHPKDVQVIGEHNRFVYIIFVLIRWVITECVSNLGNVKLYRNTKSHGLQIFN